MTTLISFLGKQQGGYKPVSYQFADGTIMENQKYMGLALYEKLKPSRLILLGTSGSMWDVFLEENSNGLEEEWMELVEAANAEQVTDTMLKPFAQFLTKKLGIPVDCVLISAARSEAEQVSILSSLADMLHQDKQVVLDVTHSFRHLPLLALVAARFLKVTQQVNIEQIFYGNFIYGAAVHPVLELKGLLTMLDWVDALSTFNKDGDYGVFASLLQEEGLLENQANLLKQAAFYERTMNSSMAKDKLGSVYGQIDKLSSPIFDLFKKQLLERITWFKRDSRGRREQSLATKYLERSDYVRAVIYAMEGLVSHRLTVEGLSEHDFTTRKEKQDAMRDDSESFRKLNVLRNALAHGVRPRDSQKDAHAALRDEKTMQQSLKDRFKHLID